MTLIFATAAAPAAYWVPLLAGVFTVVAALVAALVALSVHRRTMFIEHVTGERATWRSELRREISILSVEVHTMLAGDAPDPARFHRARVGLLMRINPDGRRTNDHPLDRKIDTELGYLARAMAGGASVAELPSTRRCILARLTQLEYAVQELLKTEWEKSKTEAKTGRMASRKRSR